MRGDTLIIQLDKWPGRREAREAAPSVIVVRTPEVLFHRSQVSLLRTAGVIFLSALTIGVVIMLAWVATLEDGDLGF